MTRLQLAERILGAVLVCSFGFILYSIFLDHEETTFVDRNTQIPAQSRFLEPLEIDEQQVQIPLPEKTPEEIFIPTEEMSSEDILDAPVLDDGIPNAWVIQVGSFSTLEKADEVRDQLISDNYKAYHRVLESEQQTLYRVLIGPYMSAEETVRHQRAVDQALDISTLLVKFEP